MTIGVNARFLRAPVGGVQRFAREVTTRLVRMGDVVLFVPRGATVPAEWSAHARVVRGRTSGQAWEQLELRAATAACDVLFNPANTAPLLPRVPQVLMLHDVFALTNPEWYARRFSAWYRTAVPAAAARAHIVLTTSDTSADSIARTLHIQRERLRVVPQGVAPFSAPAPRTDVARVLGALRITQPYVLVLGAGDARKNTAFAEAVIARLRTRGAAPVLVLVGAAARHVYGGAAAPGAGVRALGRVDDATLHALYTGAAALLGPAHREGFGRAPLEALCCGTPCLVAAYAAATEVLAGTPARLLPPGDAAVWADALAELLTARTRIGPADRERLALRWSWEDAAAVVLTACGDACAGPRVRSLAGAGG